jgi:hypothetical protein
VTLRILDCPITLTPQLRSFLTRAYGPSHVVAASEAFLHWQFRNHGPSRTADYSIKVALLDDAIVGCLGYIPVDVDTAARSWRGAWVVNWMVEAEQRRLGLGPILMREVTRQFDVTLNIGPGADARHVLQRMQWTAYGELPRYLRVLDRVAAAHLTPEGTLDWPNTPVARTHAAGATIRDVARFTDEATDLWRRFVEQGAAGASRTAEYLNWRYTEHPLFQYRLFEARQGGRLAGLAVYRVERVKGLPLSVGRIVELFSTEGLEGLLLNGIAEDAMPQAAMLDFFSPHRSHRDAMAAQGFLPADDTRCAGLPVVFQPIDRARTGIPFMAEIKKLSPVAADEWYVTKGDADQDRPNQLPLSHAFAVPARSESCDSTISA